LTVSYTFRLIYYTIVGEFYRLSVHPLNDEKWLILRRIIILVIISIIRGSILRWLLFPSPLIICLPKYLKFLTLLVCLLGGLLGYFISLISLFFFNKSFNNKIIDFFRIIWFIPIISTYFVVKLPLKIGFNIKLIDQGWREYFGAYNLFNYLLKITSFYQIVHNNKIKLYLIRFILWILLILILFLHFYLNSL